MTKSEPNFFLEFLKKYRDDPVGFVRDILRTKPDPWQIEFLKAISSGERRISVRSGHGVGKSTAASWAMLHYFLTLCYDNSNIAVAMAFNACGLHCY